MQAAETDRVLTKLSAVFNKNTTNWLGVDFTDWNCSNGNIFYGLKTAILELRIITFDYYSVMGEKTKRRAEPVQLWFKHRAWYLKAFCLTRMEERLFKLNRLQNLTVTDERFIKRYIPARLEKESNEETVQVSGKSNIITEVTLVLRFTERVAYRVYDEFGGDITGREEDGSFIVKVTWPEDDWVYGTILSYGENVEVLEPERMRGLIRAKAERIVKKYEKK